MPAPLIGPIVSGGLRLAGSPMARGIVSLYNKIPKGLTPLYLKGTPDTLLQTIGSAVNPLGAINVIQSIPIGEDSEGNTIRVQDVAPPLDPLDLLNMPGDTPQTEDPYDRWRYLRYPSKEAMKQAVEAQMRRERGMN